MRFESSLLASLKAGDPITQSEFWKHAYDDVLAICLKILESRPDATEVAVDVMSDFVFKYVHGISDEKVLFSYLRIMTIRRALKFRERQRSYTELESTMTEDSPAADPEEAAHYASLMPRLGACMDQLTPKAQQVIRLRFQYQMTQERIGGLLGGSKQYIGRLIRRSLELLRDCINSAFKKGAAPGRESAP